MNKQNKSAEEIERYGWVRQARSNDYEFEQCSDGDFIKFEDHQKAISKQQYANAELEKQNAELVKVLNRLVNDITFPGRTLADRDGIMIKKPNIEAANSILQSHESNKQP